MICSCRKTVIYSLIVITIVFLLLLLYQHRDNFAVRFISYDYSADVNSPFDKRDTAQINETLKRENTTQLIGNLFINNTEDVRKRMTAPDIEYYPRKQSIFDYSDIVL
jgi:hypothetical protein